ncbi:uncharacterized protein LOC134767966 [Penaeus indicus]|uniref:uncharacterized protein LOC134767966 n=1 Tax=Penaeus indicus TaxID=29960 RepID=UPI00300DB6A3
MWRITAALLVGLLISKVSRAQSVDEDFTPNIEASCKAGYMQITVYVKNLEYRGAVHARDFRRPECMAIGDGSSSVTLQLPLITDKDDPSYCGVRVNQTSKEKYVPVAVRIHETLELADDKFYVIKCGLQGFFNSKNETSFVGLQLLDPEHKKTKEAVFDRKYILRADMSRPDTAHSMRVKNCFSFGEPNYTAPLTDDRGCPVGNLISPFVYNETSGTAEAALRMFRFPTSNRVHFQCDVLICKGMQTCEWYPPWLWILCIVLAVLFIIMMIINIFLCSAMTCSCTKTEVIEKEPSIIEEYDPYRSWHGSQYGSRYSLNGKGYTSGASTMNSARSVSSHSDHYAIVHSRPNSRYSGHHSLKHDKHHHHHRGPPSTTGSHYSGKY